MSGGYGISKAPLDAPSSSASSSASSSSSASQKTNKSSVVDKVSRVFGFSLSSAKPISRVELEAKKLVRRKIALELAGCAPKSPPAGRDDGLPTLSPAVLSDESSDETDLSLLSMSGPTKVAKGDPVKADADNTPERVDGSGREAAEAAVPAPAPAVAPAPAPVARRASLFGAGSNFRRRMSAVTAKTPPCPSDSPDHSPPMSPRFSPPNDGALPAELREALAVISPLALRLQDAGTMARLTSLGVLSAAEAGAVQEALLLLTKHAPETPGTLPEEEELPHEPPSPLIASSSPNDSHLAALREAIALKTQRDEAAEAAARMAARVAAAARAEAEASAAAAARAASQARAKALIEAEAREAEAEEAAAAEATRCEFGVGDKVMAQFDAASGCTVWYAGVITAASASNSHFDIIYDDGDAEQAVPRQHIKPQEVRMMELHQPELGAEVLDLLVWVGFEDPGQPDDLGWLKGIIVGHDQEAHTHTICWDDGAVCELDLRDEYIMLEARD